MSHVAKTIEAVLNRPKMYTLSGKYEEVVAFLDGYYSGAAIGRMHEPAVQVWGDFKRFLAERLDVPTSDVLLEFKAKHESVELDELRKAYDEFTAITDDRQSAGE